MIFDVGFEERIQYIFKKFKYIKPNDLVDKESLIAKIADLANQNTKTINQKILLIYQIIYCRIPTEVELQELSVVFSGEATDKLINFLVQSPEYIKFKKSNLKVTFEDSENALLVDVTHTLDYPHNSGIQRVVRSLSKNLTLLSSSVKFMLIPDSGKYGRLLNENERDRLLNWHRKYIPYSHPLKSIVQQIFGFEITELFRIWYYRLKINYIFHYILYWIPSLIINLGNQKSKNTKNEILFFWDQKILIPELVADIKRVDFWSLILSNAYLKSTLIVYDLIPIYHPEFCVVTEEFAHYLRLLRYVDQVSCISYAVEKQLRDFVNNIYRSKPIIITTDYLGGDFSFHLNNTKLANNFESLKVTPKILCVGSIEPRKNNIRLLEVANSLYQKNISFELIFAGTPGWLNEIFLKLFKVISNKGVNVKYIRSPSDAELENLYSNARCTVFISLSEGFGLPIIESVLQGTPCVVSNRGSMSEIARKIGGCIEVNPEDLQSISKGIETILEDDEKWIQLKTECKLARWTSWGEYAKKVFDYSY